MSSDPSRERPSKLSCQNGATLAYHKHLATGQGGGTRKPGLVFLGGFMSDMTGTKATALEAYAKAQGRDFLRFDYQGHGASSGDFVEGSIASWLEDTLEAIDRLTKGRLVLIGSSMGGWIALLAARARPQRVQALVGVAAAPDFTETMRQALDSAALEILAAQGYLEQPSDYSDEPYRISKRLLEESRAHLLLSAPIAVDCPLRLLHGMQDEAVPWQTALTIAAQATSQDVEVTLVKSGDHRLSSEADLARLFQVIDALP